MIKKNFLTTFLSLFIVSFFILTFFVFPNAVLAQSGTFKILPDCGVDCGFPQFVELAGNVIKFLILLSIPVATISFAWAGWLMLTAGGNSGQVEKAKGIFTDVLIGLLFALTAWLIVQLIMSALLDPCSYWNPLTTQSAPNCPPKP